MALLLRHISGPLAGGEQRFGDDRERIVIGRDPALCDVVFPPDLTLLGREHVALVRKLSGDYALDLFGDHFVAIDGTAADPGMAVPSGARITLGSPDGPSFVGTVQHAPGTAALAATQPQPVSPSARQISQRTRTILLAVGCLAVAAAWGASYAVWTSGTDLDDRAALVAQLDEIRTAQAREAAERIPVTLRERLARSVFAIMRRNASGAEDEVGTAWAFRPDRLATNVHVAQDIAKVAVGDVIVARPSGIANVAYQVIGQQIHPRFAAFLRFTGEDTLVVQTYSGPAKAEAAAGYDVAVLQVTPPVPEQMVLAIADENTLLNLKPGQPVAYAGFPYENIVGGHVLSQGPTAQVHVGTITALTDFFLRPASPAQSRLVQHDLPMTGGASGSPMVDAQGRVIALVNAMSATMIGGERMPSAALTNYAQRADMLLDLIAGKATAAMPAEEAYWKTQSADYRRGADVMIANVVDRSKPSLESEAVLANEAEAVTTERDRVAVKARDDRPSRMTFVKFAMKSKTHHTVVAYGKGGLPIGSLSWVVNGKVKQHDEGGGDPYAVLSFDIAADGPQTFAVQTQDTDAAVLLRDYVWQTPSR